jgi:Tfp pilus assembly protein PilF
LLLLAAFCGCSTLQTAWLPGMPAASAVGPAAASPGVPPAAAALPSSRPIDLDQPPPPAPAKLSKAEMAQYLRDLAKGVELEQTKKYAEARAHYQQLIQQRPGQFEAYHQLAQVLDRQKRHGEAQDKYQQAILLVQNREPNLFCDLGYSFFLQGKLDKAESAARKAIALRPDEPRYHNNLGLILGHQRRFDEAWGEFRRAGGDADACYNLAFVKASLNDFEGAKESFRRVLAIDPTHDRARRALRAFELAESDPDSLAQLEVSSEGGTQWVPYVEPGRGPEGLAASAGEKEQADSGAGRGPAVRTAANRNPRMNRGR